MAADIVQLRKEAFLVSLKEEEKGLTSNLRELLQQIRDELQNKEFWSRPPEVSWPALQGLNDLLWQCLTVKESKNGKKPFFPRFGLSERNLKKQLSSKLESIRFESRERGAGEGGLTSFPTGRHTRLEPESVADAVGLDEQVKEITKWLLGIGKGLMGIGIYGMGGTGKTTLVKQVLNRVDVKQHFQTIIWVCLSDFTSQEELDVKIVKYILEYLGNDTDEFTGNRTHVWFLEQLHHSLNSGNYLIVLDDVWHSNDWFSNLSAETHAYTREQHQCFSRALPKNTASAVIVTTRLKQVAHNLVGADNLIHLQPLDKQYLKDIVTKNIGNQDIQLTNPTMVDHVADYCYGLPLVAKTATKQIAIQVEKQMEVKFKREKLPGMEYGETKVAE